MYKVKYEEFKFNAVADWETDFILQTLDYIFSESLTENRIMVINGNRKKKLSEKKRKMVDNKRWTIDDRRPMPNK